MSQKPLRDDPPNQRPANPVSDPLPPADRGGARQEPRKPAQPAQPARDDPHVAPESGEKPDVMP